MATKFVDVNKENYMKALFLDIQKQTKMVNFPDSAKLIHDFVMNNPTNSDNVSRIDQNGVEHVNGLIIIHRKR